MHNFFMKLLEDAEKPSHILFVERGVKLLLADFSAFDALKILANDYGVCLTLLPLCTKAIRSYMFKRSDPKNPEI